MRVKHNRHGDKRPSKLQRHIERFEITGQPSEWLLARCMKDKHVCRRVLPGLAEIVHKESYDEYLQALLGTYVKLNNPRNYVKIIGITVPREN